MKNLLEELEKSDKEWHDAFEKHTKLMEELIKQMKDNGDKCAK